MPIYRITHQGRPLVLGLTWTILDAVEGKASQFAEWRSKGFKTAVAYQLNGDWVYGRGDGEVIGSHSVAALVAQQPRLKGQTVLVLIERASANPDEQSQVLVVGLREGRVILDQIVLEDDVPALRANFASLVKGDFQVVGHGEHVGELRGQLTLGNLIADKRLVARSRVAVFRNLNWVVPVAVIAGLTALGAAGWAWYSHSAEARRLAAERDLLAQQTPQALYESAVSAYLAAPKVPLAEGVRSLIEQLRDFPLVQAGWEVTRMSCIAGEVEAQDACTVVWRRLGDAGGTVDDFVSKAPPEWTGIAPDSQTTVTHQLAIRFPRNALQRDAFEDWSAWRDRNITQWQRLAPGGWRVDLSNPELLAMPEALKADKSLQAEASVMGNALRGAAFNIAKQDWFYVAPDDTDSPLALLYVGPAAVLASPVELSIAGGAISFSLKGVTHVR